MTIKGILFDLDDTLVSDARTFDTAVAACFRDPAVDTKVGGDDPAETGHEVRKIARKQWQSVPEPTYVRSLGFHFLAPLVSAFPGDAPELAAIRAWLPSFRLDVWRKVLKRGGAKDNLMAARVAELFPTYLLAATRPMDGVTNLLAALTRRFRLGIVTNGPADLQLGKLRAAGLAESFQVISVSGALGFGKPDPRIFTQTLQELELPPNEVVMIGDNPVNDIQGGLDAGLQTIWLQIENQAEASVPETVPVAHSVADLFDIINGLE